jgi:low affinity Fe/Cu permease
MAQDRRVMKEQSRNVLERASERVSVATGRSGAFALACAAVVVWMLSGPFFGFSDTWQLVINTGTTIVTFLMVFLIQRSQNKESLAVQLKLNEIVAAISGASNRLIDVEKLSESELKDLQTHYERVVALAKEDTCRTESHSVEDAHVSAGRGRARTSDPGPRTPNAGARRDGS